MQAGCQGVRDNRNVGNAAPLIQVVDQDVLYGATLPSYSASPPALMTLSREITVAAGRFAAGHLGGLTPFLPFELVDAVLQEHRALQRRLRDLPSRVGVYFLLAMCLFPEAGYRLVWAKVICGLGGGVPVPSAKGLRDLRRRVGCAPMRALFEVMAGTLAQPHTPGVCFGAFSYGLLRRLQLDQGTRQ
jgi:hypothetical protein